MIDRGIQACFGSIDGVKIISLSFRRIINAKRKANTSAIGNDIQIPFTPYKCSARWYRGRYSESHGVAK